MRRLLRTNRVRIHRKLDPVPTDHGAVHHKPQGVHDVGLKRRVRRERPVPNPRHAESLFQNPSRRAHHIRQPHRDLGEQAILHVAIMHQTLLPLERHVHDVHSRRVLPRRAHLLVQTSPERRAIRLAEIFRHRRVKIRLEPVHVRAHAVSLFRHPEHPHHRGVTFRPSRPQSLVRLLHRVIDVQLLKQQRVPRRVHRPRQRSSHPIRAIRRSHIDQSFALAVRRPRVHLLLVVIDVVGVLLRAVVPRRARASRRRAVVVVVARVLGVAQQRVVIGITLSSLRRVVVVRARRASHRRRDVSRQPRRV